MDSVPSPNAPRPWRSLSTHLLRAAPLRGGKQGSGLFCNFLLNNRGRREEQKGGEERRDGQLSTQYGTVTDSNAHRQLRGRRETSQVSGKPGARPGTWTGSADNPGGGPLPHS